MSLERSSRHRVWPAALALVWLVMSSGACRRTSGVDDEWDQIAARMSSLTAIGRTAAIAEYAGRRGGTPVIETDHRLIFLVNHPGSTAPRIVGDFNGWAAQPGGVDDTVGTMTRVDDTPWWVLTTAADPDARLEYVVIRDGRPEPDPLNPRRVRTATGEASEIRMPGWIAQPELDAAAVPAGVVTKNVFRSAALASTRTVWTYLPPGYEVTGQSRYPSVYFLDGEPYVGRMEVPRVLDRLIGAGTLPPIIAVFIGSNDRRADYLAGTRWIDFVTTELVPDVDRRFRTTTTASTRVIIGSSLGAAGATRLAVLTSGVFDRVAALAPSVEAVSALSVLAGAPASVRRWFVLGGRYDWLLADARAFDTTLKAAGEPATYLEVAEGHSAETFRGHIDDALRALLPAILPGQLPIGIVALHPRLGSVPEPLIRAVMSGGQPLIRPIGLSAFERGRTSEQHSCAARGASAPEGVRCRSDTRVTQPGFARRATAG